MVFCIAGEINESLSNELILKFNWSNLKNVPSRLKAKET
jgi:hypothetical protein